MTRSAAGLATELDVARSLVLRAGEVVLSHFGTDLDVEAKRGEPVTAADRESNELITAELRRRFPDDAILAEETPVTDDAWRAAPRCWVVDPLDGTSDFVKGRVGFAVMIGLVIDGRPALGAVNVPRAGRLFTGVVGEGAIEEHDGARRELNVSSRASAPELRVIASIAHRDARLEEAIAALAPAETLSVGSVGYKVGKIVADEADLYLAMTDRLMVWDTAGPDAILMAAGGCCVDLDGEPLRYRGPQLNHERGVLATNGASTDDVVARLSGRFPRLD